jgi:hypothetical protein
MQLYPARHRPSSLIVHPVKEAHSYHFYQHRRVKDSELSCRLPELCNEVFSRLLDPIQGIVTDPATESGVKSRTEPSWLYESGLSSPHQEPSKLRTGRS